MFNNIYNFKFNEKKFHFLKVEGDGKRSKKYTLVEFNSTSARVFTKQYTFIIF